MTDDNKPVVFHDADGNEISNDPRWHAAKLLAQDKKNAENLQALGTAGQLVDSADDDDLDEMNGKQLKETAETEGVDITGLKKVSEVRTAIRAARTRTGA